LAGSELVPPLQDGSNDFLDLLWHIILLTEFVSVYNGVPLTHHHEGKFLASITDGYKI
jgi:hypothetical protein